MGSLKARKKLRASERLALVCSLTHVRSERTREI